ncbi:MAG TPA: TfpX/TfpZ family type IV pilin accessory protein [Burkholderiales bacterium]|nr:TfpX/TfpZ family type IV pilin accessory protein [Burkholderiales bacterium]
MTRWKASGLHLTISIAIAASALACMLLVWYPGPLFQAAGGNGLLFLLVGVDVVVGPLITLIVFRSGKPGMKFDLAMIALAQSAALAYGVHTVYLARPVFIVFVKDRFDVARAVDISDADLAQGKYPQFRAFPLGRPRLAFVDWPDDPKERAKLVDLAFSASATDLYQLPRLFVPYEERTKEVLKRAYPVERVRQIEPKAADVIDRYLARSGRPPDSVRFLDLRAPLAWVAVLVDAKTAQPVEMLIYDSL